MQHELAETIRQLPEYRQLTHERTRLAWVLSAIMCGAYFGYILMLAFFPSFFEQVVWGTHTTIGFPLGIGLILLAFLLTGVYVHAANTRFDALTRTIRAQVRA